MSKIVSHTPLEVEAMAGCRPRAASPTSSATPIPEPEKLASWWSYRAADFRKSNRGLRLDHIWTSPGLTPAVVPGSATIHDAVREWERPSDHCPGHASIWTSEPADHCAYRGRSRRLTTPAVSPPDPAVVARLRRASTP